MSTVAREAKRWAAYLAALDRWHTKPSAKRWVKCEKAWRLWWKEYTGESANQSSILDLPIS